MARTDRSWTVGALARRFGLSRSALLYYDSIGLLSPSARSPANYRLYSAADVERMERIDLYRRAGVPLADIAQVLDTRGGALTRVLKERLEALDARIHEARLQQQMIVRLLRGGSKLRRARQLDKERWVAILRATGLDEADMQRWHVEFERTAPAAHRDFLESLGLPAKEVDRIRRWSAEMAEQSD